MRPWHLVLLWAFGCSGGSAVNDADGCRGYSEPGESQYVLPFPVGEEYELTQGNCAYTHSGRNRFAYDFGIERGRAISAMRAGTIVKLVENKGKANYLEIEHADGSIAYYVHLNDDSIVLAKGDSVSQGDVIAEAGTINTHVVVKVDWQSQPLTFKNVPDARFGLLHKKSYLAESYEASEE